MILIEGLKRWVDDDGPFGGLAWSVCYSVSH